MIVLTRLLWQTLFQGGPPPDLINLSLPPLEERRKLIDETRESIAAREQVLQRLELLTGCDPESYWTGSPA